MPPLAPPEVRAVIDALTNLYVDGTNEGHWHLYTFTLRDGQSIHGRVVAQEDEHILVGRDEPGHQQVKVSWDDVQTLLIEVE